MKRLLVGAVVSVAGLLGASYLTGQPEPVADLVGLDMQEALADTGGWYCYSPDENGQFFCTHPHPPVCIFPSPQWPWFYSCPGIMFCTWLPTGPVCEDVDCLCPE